MRDTMSKKPAKKSGSKDGGVLAIRLDKATEAALMAFIAAQAVEPDRSAVGLKSLHEFLQRHGFWPPKPSEPKT